MFVNKRDRVLKCGWRHGILGVENTNKPRKGSRSNGRPKREKKQIAANINIPG